MTAPTTRADHAELARLAEAANVEMPSKKRSEWYRDRSAFIHAANPATVLALLSEIAALRGERNRWHSAYEIAHDQATANGSAARQAERQRDELRESAMMAAERLSIHAHTKGKQTDGDYLRASMAGVAGDLFKAANQGADQ